MKINLNGAISIIGFLGIGVFIYKNNWVGIFGYGLLATLAIWCEK